MVGMCIGRVSSCFLSGMHALPRGEDEEKWQWPVMNAALDFSNVKNMYLSQTFTRRKHWGAWNCACMLCNYFDSTWEDEKKTHTGLNRKENAGTTAAWSSMSKRSASVCKLHTSSLRCQQEDSFHLSIWADHNADFKMRQWEDRKSPWYKDFRSSQSAVSLLQCQSSSYSGREHWTTPVCLVFLRHEIRLRPNCMVKLCATVLVGEETGKVQALQ